MPPVIPQHSFEYDVALSFAGEQRSAVEQVAGMLREANVRVFYDNFEKATLWGKDLYHHLTDVYQNKARYCIVFVSKEYAQKVWTTQELKSAQARALREKGAEYILPVRFDSTELPGLLLTVGYLDFQSEGSDGICAAVLEKLGIVREPDSSAAAPCLSCDGSPRAVLVSQELSTIVFPKVGQSTWNDEIELVVRAEDSDQDALFSKFRSHSKPIIVAYGFDVAIAMLRSASRSTAGREVNWRLGFSVQRAEFSNDLEMGTQSTTADQFAEKRVRRLLLNEFPRRKLDVAARTVDVLNEAMDENLILGLNSVVKIQESKFPMLFRDFGSDPATFLEVAWISAVADLKLSGAIQRITMLKLTLSGTDLLVKFRGQRHRKYVNVDPYRIDVDGSFSLL